ncbi:MAG: hypothetical protein H7210_06120, partial [Pyrinomonadaceae bacterium]|nr:hypothetical protein [Phycisphaerales bacterium]
GKVRIYGSGLVSSHSESFWALSGDAATGKQPERRPFDLDQVCETSFEIDHFQPIYYVLESFEQLRDAMNEYAEKVLNEKKKLGTLVGGRR